MRSHQTHGRWRFGACALGLVNALLSTTAATAGVGAALQLSTAQETVPAKLWLRHRPADLLSDSQLAPAFAVPSAQLDAVLKVCVLLFDHRYRGSKWGRRVVRRPTRAKSDRPSMRQGSGLRGAAPHSSSVSDAPCLNRSLLVPCTGYRIMEY